LVQKEEKTPKIELKKVKSIDKLIMSDKNNKRNLSQVNMGLCSW